MSNPTSEPSETSSNVIDKETLNESIESIEISSDLDAPGKEVTNDATKVKITSSKLSPSTTSTSHSSASPSGSYMQPGNRERKNPGNRRNDHSGATPPYERHKGYDSRGTPQDTPGSNRSNHNYHQKPRRSSEMSHYPPSPAMYTPNSPQHSINRSGSATPTSSIQTSPLGSFQSSPALPEAQLPYGAQIMYANMGGGIAGMPRSDQGYYAVDRAYPHQQPMMISNQQVMMPIQGYMVPQGSPSSPQHQPQSSPGKQSQMMAPGVGFVPTPMPAAQPFYQPMMIPQDIRLLQPYPMNPHAIPMQAHAMNFGQPVQQALGFYQSGQAVPAMNMPLKQMHPYFVTHQQMNQPPMPNMQGQQIPVHQVYGQQHQGPPPHQGPPQQSQMNYGNHREISKSMLTVKTKDGKVYENMKAYTEDIKKTNAVKEEADAQAAKEESITLMKVIETGTPVSEVENITSRQLDFVEDSPSAVVTSLADNKLNDPEPSESQTKIDEQPEMIAEAELSVENNIAIAHDSAAVVVSSKIVEPEIIFDVAADAGSAKVPKYNGNKKEVTHVESQSAVKSSSGGTEQKSKKASLKEKAAAADARASRADNLLDAYTDAISPTQAVVDEVKVPEPENIESIPREDVQDAPEEDEDWEASADKITSGEKILNFNDQPVPVIDEKEQPKTRQLKPQGGGTAIKLNAGPTNKIGLAPLTRLVYVKNEILQHKKNFELADCPSNLIPYSQLSSDRTGNVSSSITSSSSMKGGRGGNISRSASHEVMVSRTERPTNESHDGGGWKREGNTQGNRPQGRGRDRDRDRGHVPSPPKKIITDSLEALTLQVRSILNKITPQNFEMLAGQIKELKITSTKLCDRLVYLIFEKAIYEQNFSNLYAELCQDLEQELSSWPFIHVIYFRDSNQYSWVVDLDVDSNILSGPFASVKECLNVASSEVLPQARPISAKLSVSDLIVTNNTLVKIFKNESITDVQYFCSFMSISDIPAETRAQVWYHNHEDARKNAVKKNAIKGRLLRFCQDEFRQTDKVNMTDSSINPSDIDRSKLTEEQLQELQRNEEIYDRLKRRLLGTIRFIGELFKKGLVTAHVLIDCITTLLCNSFDADNISFPLNFKSSPPDIDLEVLCKLMRTVGKEFESQTQNKSNQQIRDRVQVFNDCLRRMHELSTDKKRSSRIRFSLEEVIFLKENGWVERRQEEGPQKIEEIHRRIEEENKKAGLMNISYNPSAGKISFAPKDHFSGRGVDSGRGRGSSDRGGRGYIDSKPGRGQPIDKTRSLDSYKGNVSSQSAYNMDDLKSSVRDVSDSSSSSRYMENEIDSLKSLFEDYLSAPLETDVPSYLSNKSPQAIAQFVIIVLNKYVQSTSSTIHAAVIELLGKIQAFLHKSKGYIVAELIKFEPLILLSDYVLDMKLAPEYFGEFLGQLLNLEVIDIPWLQEFIRSVYDDNVDVSSKEETDAAYNRLMITATNIHQN